jgi:hypothetical protein
MCRRARTGLPRPGRRRRSPAQPSPAQPSPAQPSPAQPSPAQPSPAQPSSRPPPAPRSAPRPLRDTTPHSPPTPCPPPPLPFLPNSPAPGTSRRRTCSGWASRSGCCATLAPPPRAPRCTRARWRSARRRRTYGGPPRRRTGRQRCAAGAGAAGGCGVLLLASWAAVLAPPAYSALPARADVGPVQPAADRHQVRHLGASPCLCPAARPASCLPCKLCLPLAAQHPPWSACRAACASSSSSSSSSSSRQQAALTAVCALGLRRAVDPAPARSACLAAGPGRAAVRARLWQAALPGRLQAADPLR